MELHNMGCASRRLAVPVAAVLLSLTAGGASSESNPAATIAATAGHPARLHLRAQASRVVDGQTQTTTLDVAGTKRLNRVCVADLCTGTWFDGTHNAAFGINGEPFPDRAEDDGAERTLAAIASTAFAESDFASAGGTVAALTARGDGQLRFRVTTPQGSALIAVADARTHRLTGVESVDGTPYRRLLATATGATILYASRAYDRVAIVAAPAAPEPPAGPRVDLANPSEIELLSATLPIVPCKLKERRARCLIDTGTNPSAVTLDFAEQLGSEPRGQVEIAGLGSYLTGVIDAGPLVLGSATFERLLLAVIPRPPDAGFDVIIGSDALGDLRIAFDRDRRRARILPAQSPAAGPAISLSFERGVAYARVRLDSHEDSEPMLVDTGDSETLSIGYDRYRKEPELFTVRGSAVATGVGGVEMDALQGELTRIEIDGERVDRVPVSAVRGQHTGHIGYGFAARCEPFVIDFGQRRIECRAKSATTRQSTREP